MRAPGPGEALAGRAHPGALHAGSTASSASATWAASTCASARTARSTSWRSTRSPRSSRAPASTPPRRWRGCTRTRVLGAVIQSAVARLRHRGQAAARRGRPRRTEPLRVGFTFNVKRVTPDLSGEQDDEAEYDSPKTLQAIREAIASYGHEVVDLEATQDLPAGRWPRPRWTWSSTSPRASRAAAASRRCRRCSSCSTSPTPARTRPRSPSRSTRRWPSGWCAPTASSPPTSPSSTPARSGFRASCEFPLLVKPVAEGTSKGVTRKSIVARRGRAARGGARAHRQVPASRRWWRGTSPGASSRWGSWASGGRGCCRPWRSSSSTRPTRRPSTPSR